MLGLQIYQANPLDLDLGGEVLASESLWPQTFLSLLLMFIWFILSQLSDPSSLLFCHKGTVTLTSLFCLTGLSLFSHDAFEA